MILHAKAGFRGTVIDTITGNPVRWVRWVDADTGDYEAFREDPVPAKARGVFLRSLLYRGKCRLPLTTVSQVTLPGMPLNPVLSPAEEVREIRTIAKDYVPDYRPIIATPGIECDEPLCHRLATWAVGHEQEIDPGRMADGSACERAVTTKVQRWCSTHFRPGTFTSVRGVETEQELTCRPQ